MRRLLASRSFLTAATAVSVAFGIVAVLRLGSTSIDDLSLGDLHWGFAALATACAASFVVVYALAWWQLVGALAGRRPHLVAALRLFVLTWPGRYTPASLPYYGGRLVAGPKLGLSRGAVTASLVYENIFAIAGSGTLSLALFAVGFRDRIGGGLWFAVACAASACAMLVLHPAVLRRLIGVAAARVVRLRALDDYVLPAGAVLRIAATYAGGAVLSGLAFYFALRSVAPDTHPPLLLAVATYNIAGIAGMLALAVPSGLGVREGVAVALIGAVVSPPVALSAAVLARLLALAADLALAAVALAWALAEKLRQQNTATPEAAAPDPIIAQERRAA